MRVIGLAADGFPESTGDAYRLCINCGYCVDICSFDALRHRIRKRTTDSAAALIRYEASQKARLRNLTK
jgi:ferredoxin